MYKLLLVDDDRAILELFSLALDRPGLLLLTAGSVTQALHVIKMHPVNAAILDVQLTTANRCEGLEVLRRLRELRPDAEAIVMTGSAIPNLEEAAYEAGAWKFLRKPIELRELERQLLKLGLPAAKHQRPAAARTTHYSTASPSTNRFSWRTAVL